MFGGVADLLKKEDSKVVNAIMTDLRMIGSIVLWSENFNPST